MKETRFKQTDIGPIPHDWEVVAIEDLFHMGNGYTPSKEVSDYWENGTIPWFRMEDIRQNGRILSDSIQHVTPKAVNNRGLFPAYSIIISTTATIGEHALLIADSLANQQFTFLWNVNRRQLDPYYAFYHCYLLGEWCRNNINFGGLTAVNMQAFRKYPFVVPPVEEQRRIADALGDVDALIGELERLVAKKRLVKQGAMQQLLTGRRRLPGFSSPWKTVTMKDAFDFGNGYTPSTENPEYWDNGTLPWFRVEDIKQNGHVLTDSTLHITSKAVKRGLFPHNSFIISTSATIGEYALLKCEALANQRFVFMILRPNAIIEHMYFLHHCALLGQWCRENADVGSSFPTVNTNQLLNYQIYLPSDIAEQRAIADILTDMDAEIDALERKLAKLRLAKQGMMQQLLTGRIRLIPIDINS